MANDIGLAVGDGVRRMTYAEIAAVRGISVPSARRLVLRHRWPRQVGNDGVVRVTVPLEALENPKETTDSHVTVTDAPLSHAMSLPTTQVSDATSHLTDTLIVTLTRAVDSLAEQLAIANRRADQAEERAVAAEAERRRVQERLTALLTHRSTASVPAVKPAAVRAPWWRRWLW